MLALWVLRGKLVLLVLALWVLQVWVVEVVVDVVWVLVHVQVKFQPMSTLTDCVQLLKCISAVWRPEKERLWWKWI